MRPKKIFGFRINKAEIMGLVVALIIVALDFLFLFKDNSSMFYFVLGLAFVIGGFPFFLYLVFESNRALEKEAMFLEFARNLVENVKAGTPVSKAILNIRTKDYGPLNPHINKLANQILIGIPIKTAFETFSRDLGNNTISRAINIISESEKAGGEIESILEAVVTSVSQIQKLKKERRSAMYSLIVQGYIIFLIFIIIMIVMEFKILPIATGFSESYSNAPVEDMGGFGGLIGGGGNISAAELSQSFLWLLIVQGFFTGLIVGKLSEGKVKSGLKHSFILMVMAILINTGAKVLFK